MCWRPSLCPTRSTLQPSLPALSLGTLTSMGCILFPLPSVFLLGLARGRHWQVQQGVLERKAGVFIPRTPSLPGCPLVVSVLLFPSLQLLSGDPLRIPVTISPPCPSQWSWLPISGHGWSWQALGCFSILVSFP